MTTEELLAGEIATIARLTLKVHKLRAELDDLREQIARDIESHAAERWTDHFYSDECARIARGLPESPRS